jgi:hypothetical protein
MTDWVAGADDCALISNNDLDERVVSIKMDRGNKQQSTDNTFKSLSSSLRDQQEFTNFTAGAMSVEDCAKENLKEWRSLGQSCQRHLHLRTAKWRPKPNPKSKHITNYILNLTLSSLSRRYRSVSRVKLADTVVPETALPFADTSQLPPPRS